MTSDEKPDDVNVERDHPQRRKAEPDARGPSQRREGGERPSEKKGREEGRHSPNVADLAKEAEAVRRKAVGEERARNAFGSDRDGGE